LVKINWAFSDLFPCRLKRRTIKLLIAQIEIGMFDYHYTIYLIGWIEIQIENGLE